MTDLNELRKAANSSSAEPAIDRSIGDASAEEIAGLLAQTDPSDRFLRIVLRNRLAKQWPRSSDQYQDACIFLAAERVGTGARAYASELGVHGNEYATLNDAVLERHVRSADGDHRIAAAQMMRPRHLPLLERQLERERDAAVRSALVAAGRRIAGERGAPPSPLLAGPQRLAQLVRLFGRDRGWLRWSTAAECLGAGAEELQAAAAEQPAIRSSGACFFVAEGGRTPPPQVPEEADAREVSLRLAHSSLARVKTLSAKRALDLAKLWLRAQTELWLPELRYWLGLPSVEKACEGLLLRSGDTPLRVRAGAVEGDVDVNATVLVHHPIDGPESPWRAQAPTWQTERPCFTADQLPDVEAAPAIPLVDWTKRTKALGYAGIRERRAVINTVRSEGNVRIHHSGHGHGYGKGPQQIRSIAFPTRSAAAVSEVVWDLRRLLGLDPLTARR